MADDIGLSKYADVFAEKVLRWQRTMGREGGKNEFRWKGLLRTGVCLASGGHEGAA
ncbi:MAG: hypothetical protein ACU0B1_04295 [Thermohalobaculum sp.]